MGNDIEIKVKVTNGTGTGLASVNSSLQTLKTRADNAATAVTRLRTATANAITLTTKLDDQTTAGMAALKEAVLDLQTTPRIDLEVGLRDHTAPPLAEIQQGMATLRATPRVDLEVGLDDQTATGLTAVRTAVQDLRGESPVRLDVTFDGQTGEITAAAQAMRDLKGDASGAGTALSTLTLRSTAAAAALDLLKDSAEGASRALRTLRGRAAAAAAAMGDLRTSTTGASTSLRSFNTRAQTSDTRLGALSDRSRTLRGDMDDLDGSLRRVGSRMGALRGNLGSVGSSAGRSGGGMDNLRKGALLLAPALIPIAASLVPIAAGAAAAGAGLAVLGLAVGGQVKAMMDASAAQTKYEKAVREHGRASEQATKAEAAYLAELKEMPAATREAAAATGILKKEYGDWSDALAADTMPVVTKSMGAFGALLPKLTPLVRGTATELDNLITVGAGGIQTPGFERFMDKLADWSQGALARATLGLVRLSQATDSGEIGKDAAEFMDFVRESGPVVGETLGNLARALTHLVVAASDTGVGLLSLVNALAQLVNAVPTNVLSTLLGLYTGIRLVSLAAAGLAAVTGSAAVARLGAYFAIMRAAGVGTTLRATAASMTAMQKAGVGLAVLAVAAIGVKQLADNARGAPPDVDKLSTSLKNLAISGKATGEFKKTFGDMDGLVKKVRELGKATKEEDEYVKSFGNSGIGPLDDFRRSVHSLFDDFKDGKGSAKALAQDFESLDASLADLAGSGHSKEAAAGFADIKNALLESGMSAGEIGKLFPEYTAAVADLAAEQRLTAAGMGVFGEQAIAVQGKLEAQKQSADGLRQSIEALNAVNRAGLTGMIGFEAAIDAAAKATKDAAKGDAEHGKALSMKNGDLDLNTKRSRDAATALIDLATKTGEAAASARESGASWEKVNGVYARGRRELIKQAQAMGLGKDEARAYADSILKIPSGKTTRLKMASEDATRDLQAFNSAVKRTPGSKSVTLKTLSKSAEQILQNFGYKVRRLPDGSVTVTAATGGALRGIGNVAAYLRGLRDRTVTVTTRHLVVSTGEARRKDLKAGHYATGGRVRGYASGGEVQAIPEGGYVQGPGSGTSDSILALLGSGARARVSNTEYVLQASAVRKYGVGMLDALNAGRLRIAGYAKGGLVTKAAKERARRQEAAKRARALEMEARSGARGDLTVSHFGRAAGRTVSEFGAALGRPDGLSQLVSALNSWRGVIMKATHGRQERALLKQLDSVGKSLIKHERSLSKVNGELDKAKSKLSDLKNAASQLAASVKSNVLSSANITRGASGDGLVTTASVMGGLIDSRDKSTAFDQALKDLVARGLSKDFITQIGEAGVDGGGLETATALLGASSSEIRSMNQLQAEITKAATSAGKTTANAVYGAQIKAQEKLVRNLTTQQTKLEKAMAKLAAVMEKSIEKAFGKKAAGGIVGAAASGGIRGGLTLVGEEGPEIARLPVGSRVYPTGASRRMAWDSMLNTPQRPTAPAGRYAGGGTAPQQPVVVLQTIQLDGKVIARQIFDPMRDEVLRRSGGDVQKALGRRNGNG
ncbi:phage minor tail protein [Streptomyces sp. CBMAI 2042]|uniref:phage tail protein n=1 Tax=Streptomyces sp. CBMAI 2042 TaxID=2305222 RepID=UPI000F0F9F7E|nr:phage tail protein [Streptomyces sp. CBMAI 2042]RLV66357.1 phage minor tail protein [Streptomyces sp. CBMAI 2042]